MIKLIEVLISVIPYLIPMWIGKQYIVKHSPDAATMLFMAVVNAMCFFIIGFVIACLFGPGIAVISGCVSLFVMVLYGFGYKHFWW